MHPSSQVIADADLDGKEDEKVRPVWLMLGLIFMGLVLVIFSSRFVIGSVAQLTIIWKVPDVVISSTIVAFGTSRLTIWMNAGCSKKRW